MQIGNLEHFGINQRDKTLSKTGKYLVAVLDFLDKKHCFNSINNDIPILK
jgi:hypothetical protein